MFEVICVIDIDSKLTGVWRVEKQGNMMCRKTQCTVVLYDKCALWTYMILCHLQSSMLGLSLY